jgi:hypothetical protein
MQSSDIVDQAKTWIGVRFRHCGRSRTGVDCAGLVIKVAHEMGFTTFDTREYARRPNIRAFLKHFKDHMDPVPKGEMRSGDVLLTREIRFPAHCGILEIDDQNRRWLIHAYEPCGQVVREGLSKLREQDIIHVFRYRTA